MKLGFKLTGFFVLFTLSASVLFYAIVVRTQDDNYKQIALENIQNVQAAFHNLEERDTQMLFSTLEAIVRDSRLKEVYLRKNREELFSHVQPLFRKLKNSHGITHFYFILPDGRVFLRMHGKELHGDLINRRSFRNARDTKGPAREIELGKTAFALRAVIPYYEGKTLIGYIELGEGIDHFLKILKEETNSEFGIIGDKVYLDGNDWKSLRRVAGLRDNWDDLEKHLVIGSTSDAEPAARCFTESNMERVEKGERLFQQVRARDRAFMCGGFSLTDAEGRHIGAILALMDITDHAAAAAKTNKALVLTAVLLFFFTGAAGVLISRSLTRPILQLTRAARAVGKGNLEQSIPVNSTDELGQLAQTFNAMVEKRKRAEDALAVKMAELERSNEDLEHFASIVSHDLKEPLTSIGGFVYLLESKYGNKLDARGVEFLSRVRKGAEHMELLINDLLAYAGVTTGVKPFQPVACNGLLELVTANLGSSIKASGATITFDPLPTVTGDKMLLAQLFQNLIGNAIKYRDAAPPRIHIGAREARASDGPHEGTGRPAAEDKTWLFSVSDNGIGIGPRDFDRIFLLFERLYKNEEKYPGTGIGLAICKKIVERHGGRIWVESEPGKGTTFYFTIPS